MKEPLAIMVLMALILTGFAKLLGGHDSEIKSFMARCQEAGGVTIVGYDSDRYCIKKDAVLIQEGR